MLFGEVMVKLPRLACAGCGCGETGPEVSLQIDCTLTKIRPTPHTRDVLELTVPYITAQKNENSTERSRQK